MCRGISGQAVLPGGLLLLLHPHPTCEGVRLGAAPPPKQPQPVGADACPRSTFQSPDYQTKKMETKALRNKLFHIKRMVSDYDKVRG